MRILKSLIVTVLVLITGCSSVDGVSVVVRPESAEAFKEQAEAFIRAKGFGPVRQSEGGGFVLALSPDPDNGPRRGLYASFFREGDSFRFFVGKANNRSFSDQDKKVVGEFIDFLIQHSAMLQSGSASPVSSTGEARAAFHAKFKKS